MTVNSFDNFNLSESSWSMTSCSQFLNFHQWWDRMRVSFAALLNIVFSCLSSIIKIKMIFWWLIENLAEFSSKSVFKSASQLLNWAIMLLYASLSIFNKLILILLWSDESTEQSESLFSLTKIIEISSEVSLLKILSHSNSCKKFLWSFISH